jgi:sensor histidine kinase YesM
MARAMAASTSTPGIRRIPWARAAGVFTLWTLAGLFFSTQHYLHIARVLDGESSWRRSLLSTLPDWYLWGALSPAVFWLCRRRPIERSRLASALAVHALAAAAISSLHLVLAVGIFLWLQPIPDFRGTWANQLPLNFILSFHWNVIIYIALAVWSHARGYSRRAAERERQALALEARLSEARLQALRARLEPHFLFNALNAIAELIHHAPDRAEEMLLRLSDLLRAALKESPRQEVPLREELALVDKYLEIEKLRFGERLRIETSAEPAVLDARVPSWVLQPLVENSLRHGVARRAGAGLVTIRARRDDGALELEVTDNGPGSEAGAEEARREGIGLASTRERLRELYGSRQRLSLEGVPGGGTRVVVRVPLAACAADPAGAREA